MFPIVAGVLGSLMILFVAARGLRPGAALKQRLYSGATGTWAVLGVLIYHPAGMMRWVPHALSGSIVAQSVFGFGLLALAITGASFLMGGE